MWTGSCCCKLRDAVWTKSVPGHDWLMLLSLARVALEIQLPSSPPPMACILSFSLSPPPSFFPHLSSSFSQSVALHPLLLQHMKPSLGGHFSHWRHQRPSSTVQNNRKGGGGGIWREGEKRECTNNHIINRMHCKCIDTPDTERKSDKRTNSITAEEAGLFYTSMQYKAKLSWGYSVLPGSLSLCIILSIFGQIWAADVRSPLSCYDVFSEISWQEI